MQKLPPQFTPRLTLVLGLAAAFAVHFYFVWHHTGLWGVDGGAYLLSQHYVTTGEQIVDFKRPWLAPGFLLIPFTWAFGDDWGIRTFALVSWLPMMVPVWLFARIALTRWQAVVSVLGVAFGLMLAEMFVAGSLPMVAFTGTFFCMWAVWRLCGSERPEWKHRISLALGIAWMAYTNQTSVGIALYLLPFWAIISIWLQPGTVRRKVRNMAVPVFAGAVLALPTIPFFIQTAPGSGMLRYPGPMFTTYNADNAVWYYMAMFGPFAGYIAWRATGFIRGLAVLMLLSLPIGAVYSFDESILNITYRTRYLYTIYFYILAAWFGWHILGKHKRWLAACVLGAFAVLIPLNIYQLHFETKLKRMVTADVQDGIEWLQAKDFPGGIGTNSYSMGLWVSAWTKKPVTWLQVWDPPPFYAEQHNNMACLVAWDLDCDVPKAINELDVDYLLIERVWPASNAEIAGIEGVGGIYDLVDRFSVMRWKQFGATWNAPKEADAELSSDPYPWQITSEYALWLIPVWQQGTAKIWEVNRAYASSGDTLASMPGRRIGPALERGDHSPREMD